MKHVTKPVEWESPKPDPIPNCNHCDYSFTPLIIDGKRYVTIEDHRRITGCLLGTIARLLSRLSEALDD